MHTPLSFEKIRQFLQSQNIPFDVAGDTDTSVANYCTLDAAKNDRIFWIKNWNEQTAFQIESLRNVIVICKKQENLDTKGKVFLFCESPKMVFFEIIAEFFSENVETEKIAETSVILTDKIGQHCSIGEFTLISRDAEIGDHVIIGNRVSLIGKVRIGNYSVIADGAVIGKSGYGYYLGQDGHRKKVPHLGGVVIGASVEVGANSCIDRGTMGDTVIGDNTKIDNLCHIGHNVQIANDVMIVAGTSICGSCKIGHGAYIAPGSVIKNQTHIAGDAFVGMQSCVMKDVAEGESVFGVPARPFKRDYKV